MAESACIYEGLTETQVKGLLGKLLCFCVWSVCDNISCYRVLYPLWGDDHASEDVVVSSHNMHSGVECYIVGVGRRAK